VESASFTGARAIIRFRLISGKGTHASNRYQLELEQHVLSKFLTVILANTFNKEQLIPRGTTFSLGKDPSAMQVRFDEEAGDEVRLPFK